jgi:hypothetical protein
MNGRRAIVGLCMLCALVFSAFAAQGAAAATKGTTAFTCIQDPFGTLIGAHCLTTGSGEKYSHVAIAENTTTELKGTNANTASGTTAAAPSILKVTIAGTPLELQATTVTGTGSATNKKAASGEHFVSGTGEIVYTGVTVLKPEGKGCDVYEDNAGVEGTKGTVKTVKLKATTEGQGDFLKFEPNEGTTFANFFITCTNPEVPEVLKGTWTVTGSLKCPVTGATTVCGHEEITTQNTLKAKGSKAGLSGALTISGRDPLTDPATQFRPLSNTTVETP